MKYWYLVLLSCVSLSIFSGLVFAENDYQNEGYPQYPIEQKEGIRKGMTFAMSSYNNDLNITLVSCYGKPTPENAKSCNAYEGDTSCGESLPILCMRKTGEPRPPYSISGKDHAMTNEAYRGWAEGDIALTSPVKGTALRSERNASDICEAQLGDGYRMATFHDSRWVKGMSESKYYYDTWPKQTYRGGWHYWAYGKISNESRFWVYIEDQNANCWQEDLNHQRELYKKSINSIRNNPDAYPESKRQISE